MRFCKRKEDGKASPLFVRMSSEDEKWAVLIRAKHLRNCDEPMSKVFVNRDMSREEMERDFKLRALLAEKRRSGEMAGLED